MKVSNQFYTFTQEELKAIADRIKERMNDLDISQSKLARESGLSRTQIHNMIFGEYLKKGSNKKEFRQPKPDTYQKICKALNCGMEYLRGETEHTTYDLQFICDYTGLSEKAVKVLHRQKIKADNILDTYYDIHYDEQGNVIREERHDSSTRRTFLETADFASLIITSRTMISYLHEYVFDTSVLRYAAFGSESSYMCAYNVLEEKAIPISKWVYNDSQVQQIEDEPLDYVMFNEHIISSEDIKQAILRQIEACIEGIREDYLKLYSDETNSYT